MKIYEGPEFSITYRRDGNFEFRYLGRRCRFEGFQKALKLIARAGMSYSIEEKWEGRGGDKRILEMFNGEVIKNQIVIGHR